MQLVEVGSVFAGHRLDSIAGQGGMGVVYRATHLRLDRKVALKVISPALAGDEDFRERFKRESRTAASLRHPHIVTIYDAGEESTLLYITMELVDGTDLRQVIRSQGALEPTVLARILGQIASSLDAAHERQLVHRDVKPANILVQGSGDTVHSYLTDFGLTRHASSVSGPTRTGQWVGTLDYVAPEQLEGVTVDGRADIYSLACVAYEGLTGKVPYPRDNELAKMWAQVHEAPPAISEQAPGLPSSLNKVIADGMAKDRDARYASAVDFASDFASALGGQARSAVVAAVAEAEAEQGSTAAPAPKETKAPAPRATRTRAARPAPAPGAPETKASPKAAAPEAATPASRLGWALAGLAGIGALVVGLVLGGGSEEPTGAQVENRFLELSYGSEWEEDVTGGREITGLRLEDTAALDFEALSGAGILRAGLVAEPGQGIDPIPAALGGRLGNPKPETVEVAGTEALMYEGKTKGRDSSAVALLMVPTTEGWVGVGCESPATEFERVSASCEEVSASMDLKVKAIALGPDEDAATEIGDALATLGEAQDAEASGLDANKPGEQAAAADRLAEAYSDAASKVRDNVPADAKGPVEELGRALDEIGAEFEQLAAAARGENSSAYAASRKQIAEPSDALDRNLKLLESYGYEFN